MNNSLRLLRVAGIDVGIHYTWVLAFGLIAWSLAQGFFPSSQPGLDAGAYWLLGILAALGLFASVLAHELSHSLVALARGLKVHSITLFIFGGVTKIDGQADEPRDEFLVAIVGPLSSFGLAAVFWVLNQALAPGDNPLGALLGYLAFINLMLAVFNLVPGFPLDGGRVLRSIIWGATRNLGRATQIASYVGQAVGFLLIFWGLSRLFGGEFLGGLWTAFIGWFLNNAAEAARQQQTVQENLREVRVGELMDPHPAMADSYVTVQEFITEHVLRRGRRALLVGDGRHLLGIVSITDAKSLPQDLWASTPLEQIMTRPPLRTIAPDADLSAALGLLVEGGLNQLPVLENGLLVGLLSRSDILRFLQFRDELRLHADQPTRAVPDRATARPRDFRDHQPNASRLRSAHTTSSNRG